MCHCQSEFLYYQSHVLMPSVLQTAEGVGSVLLMVRFLSLMRGQILDATDVSEALERGGQKSENADELVAKIMSLTSSNEFFIPQALQYIKKVRIRKELTCRQSQTLPLPFVCLALIYVCILHMYVCNVRTVCTLM